MGITVGFKDQRRAANGKVTGEVTIVWKEKIRDDEIQLLSVGKKFDFPQGGEQQILNESFDVKAIRITAKVKVFEKAGSNQVCVQGRLEASALGLIDIGRDLDENCHPIQQN